MKKRPVFQNNNRFGNFVELVQQRASEQPKRTVYIFLRNGETETGRLTYEDLDRRAKEIATALQPWRGKQALLLYPSGLEFIEAFFGCLYAGVIAVPVYPPRKNQKLLRLISIVTDAEAKVALTTEDILANIQRSWKDEPLLSKLEWLTTNSIKTISDEQFFPKITSETLAFLQYTSGSTGKPKGVMITHANLIHNSAVIQQCFQDTSESVAVSWLPLYHDMGLIGGILQTLYVDFPMVLMPPIAFLQKPIRWLQAITKYQATITGGPNFAYDLCVQKVKPDQLNNLDLSSWKVAINAAENVRWETLEKFTQTFAQCGFRQEAFYPCYGMAETTVLITGGKKTAQPVTRRIQKSALQNNQIVETQNLSDSWVVVGCGYPQLNDQIAIADPNLLTRCSEGRVGEIWLSGKSVARGYWHQPEATQQTFQAYFADTAEGPFLRTGDLGFLWDGELFVTGRLKDTIVIHGQNHYPQDIEFTVQNRHPALISNSGVAFTVEIQGQERLIVVQEVERSELKHLNKSELLGNIAEAVAAQHGLKIEQIVLTKPGSIPKTSSGKVQRSACREKFINEYLSMGGKPDRESI